MDKITIISGLFEQIPDLSGMLKKLLLAGMLLTVALALMAVVTVLFHRYMREYWAKTEFSNLRLMTGIIVAVIALGMFLAAIAVIKSISVA